MRKLQWLLLFPVNLVFSVLCVLISPIAAFFVTDDRRFLLQPFVWLETMDNDLGGDDGWKEEHLIGKDPLSWLNRTRWLIRNGGNKISYGTFGCPDAYFVKESKYYWKNIFGYWLYSRPIWITKTRFIDLFIGWNLPGAKQGRAKFTSSFRLKTKL